MKRVHRVGVWLSEIELAEIERFYGLPGLARLVMNGSAHERCGHKRASELMRTLLVNRRLRAVVPEVNRQAYAELGRVGNNLNQCAAALNKGLLDPNDAAVVRQVVSELAGVRQAVLGLNKQAD